MSTGTAPPPLTLWHGVTQNGRCWGPFGERLASSWPCRMPDLPGHGPDPEPVTDLDGAVDRLVGADPGILLGYSMGGRVALRAALRRPEAVAGLVLIGAHPGIEDADARAERARLDDERAAELRRVGLPAFLDDWLRMPLFADLDNDQACLIERLTNDADAVAEAFVGLGTGRQQPMWDRLDQIRVPVLVLAGERDERYVDVGRRTTAAIGPGATVATVPAAGHAAHLEQPEATAALVLDWLTGRFGG